jgi:hypothetical protein
MVSRVVGIVDTLVLEFNFNVVDKDLCVPLDDIGMVDDKRDKGDMILLLLQCHLCKSICQPAVATPPSSDADGFFVEKTVVFVILFFDPMLPSLPLLSSLESTNPVD